MGGLLTGPVARSHYLGGRAVSEVSHSRKERERLGRTGCACCSRGGTSYKTLWGRKSRKLGGLDVDVDLVLLVGLSLVPVH